MSSLTPEYALLCADVTEFSKAMETTEHAMGMRTMRWVKRCADGWLSELCGKLLQQAGDAIYLAFEDADMAVRAAQRLKNDWSETGTQSALVIDDHELRIALHWGHLMQGDHGFVGHSLNVISRLCSMVLPGQIWCSAEFCLQLSPAHRLGCEPLDTFYFKHIEIGEQVWRLKTPSPVAAKIHRTPEPPQPRLLLHSENDAFAQTWVSTCLSALEADHGLEVAEWAGPMNSGGAWVDGLMRQTRADFLLLRRAHSSHPVVEMWASPMPLKIRTWSGPHFPSADARNPSFVIELLDIMHEHMTSKARCQTDSTLSHGQLQGAALHMMHAGNLRDFHRAGELLAAWSRRFNRHAPPHLWKALWHVLRHTRGLGRSEREDALHHAKQALVLEPEHAHAHAVHGFVMAHLQGDIEGGMRELEQAQKLGPHLRWVQLYRSVLWCLLNEPERAMQDIGLAQAHMPQDATQGFALGLAGHAAVFDHQPALAIQWLEMAWRKDRHHSPVLRMLVVAHQMLGQTEMAHFFLRQLLQLEPQLTARSYLARGRAGHARRLEMAHWLMAAGLPMK